MVPSEVPDTVPEMPSAAAGAAAELLLARLEGMGEWPSVEGCDSPRQSESSRIEGDEGRWCCWRALVRWCCCSFTRSLTGGECRAVDAITGRLDAVSWLKLSMSPSGGDAGASCCCCCCADAARPMDSAPTE
uniref:Uncharacterized protein n=1 Tax=Anopheles epiroticus TaxID=199890 RepID=A0A182PYD3_9DIPT